MNNNLNKLFKAAKKNADLKEKENKKVEKKIINNSKIMYLELMKELVKEYKKNPFDSTKNIELNIPLLKPTNLTNKEKYYCDSQSSNSYLIYENPNNKKTYLVDAKQVKDLFFDCRLYDVSIDKPENTDKNNYWNFKICCTIDELRDIIIKLTQKVDKIGSIIAIKAILETARQELNFSLFQKRIEKNNKVMLIEINQELVKQYQKDPLDNSATLWVKKELRYGINTTDETEKYYLNLMSEERRNKYFLYDSINSGKPLLISSNDIKDELLYEGINERYFYDPEDGGDYKIFQAKINLVDFRDVIEKHTKGIFKKKR